MVKALADSKTVKKMLRKIRKAKTRQELVEKNTMELLYSLLTVFGNGQRTGAVQQHTIEEFHAAEEVDGIWVARVKDHKTGKQGIAAVVYLLPGLYKAVKAYIRAEPHHPVFINSLGNSVKPKLPHTFLKERLLADMGVLTGEQLIKLSSKAWRKVLS